MALKVVMKLLPEVGMLTHREAVAPDVDDVAVRKETFNERRGHDFIAEDLAPILEALVAGEHGGSMLVAAAHELEEMHGARARHGEIADLVDDQKGWIGQRLHPVQELAGPVGFLEAHDEIGEGAIVDTASALGRGDRQADGQVCLAHTGGVEEDDILLAFDEPSVERLSICSLFSDG